MSTLGNIVNFVKENKVVTTAVCGILAVSFAYLIKDSKPTEITGEIRNLGWETNVTVSKLKTVKESGWTAPAGARVINTEWTFKEMEKVPTGKDEHGFTAYAEKPVYATKYYYEVKKWVPVRNGKRSNIYGLNQEISMPSYADVELKDDEKITRRDCTCYITVMNNETGELNRFNIDRGVWCSLYVGALVRITYSKLSRNTAKSVNLVY